MTDRRSKVDNKKVDPKEFEVPETVFIRDIENRVFQGIVLQVLSHIEGITLIEGNFIDSLLGRNAAESIKGIYAEQDPQNQTIKIRVEVNMYYGACIPEKSEEIQMAIAEAITKLTGLHVASVHLVVKNILPQENDQKNLLPFPSPFPPGKNWGEGEEYSDVF